MPAQSDAAGDVREGSKAPFSGSRLLIAFAVLTLVYAGAAITGLELAEVSGAGSTIWPAAGIGLAGLILTRLRLWPAIALGSLLAFVLTGAEIPFWAQLVLAAGNGFATLLGAALVRRLAGTPSSDLPLREVAVLIGAALLLASVTSTVGVATLAYAGEVEPRSAFKALVGWLSGDAVGALVVGVFLLSWRDAFRGRFRWLDLRQLLGSAAVAAIGAWLIFGSSYHTRGWMIFPFLLLIALAARVRGAAVGLAVLTVMSLVGTIHGTGPFAPGPGIVGGGIPAVQQFLIVTSATILLLAAAVDERNAEAKLQAATEELFEREGQLNLAIEYAPSAVAMFDRDMRYIAHSRRYLADYGLGDRVLIGLSHYEVFPALPERWKVVHRRALENGEEASSEQDSFVGPDGRTVWLRWSIQPWRTAAGTIGGLVLFSEVITDQVESQQRLKASEAEARETFSLLRLLVENAPDPIWLRSADGRMLLSTLR